LRRPRSSSSASTTWWNFRDIADVLAGWIPGARKVVMKGLGHLPTMEVPEVSNRVILDFLDSLAAS
jgi:pimeloyl-ACP methyl ester carboxylesterase